jgi:ankyrin repeat protein
MEIITSVPEIRANLMIQADSKTMKSLWCTGKKFWEVYHTPIFHMECAKSHRKSLSFQDLIRLLNVPELYSNTSEQYLKWVYKFCFDLLIDFIDFHPDKIPEGFPNINLLKSEEFFNQNILTTLLDADPNEDTNKFVTIGLIKMILVNLSNKYTKNRLINARNLDGYTLLMQAITVDRIDIVKYLLSENVDITFTSIDALNASEIAYALQRYEILELLHNQQSNINTKGNNGNTSLMIAVANNAPKEHISNLIKRGADIHLSNNDNTTPLIMASKYANTEIIELLFDENIKDVQDNMGFSAFLMAISHNRFENATMLMNLGANIHLTSNGNNSALMYASLYNYYDLAKVLVSRGIDVNLANGLGQTSLMMSASKGNYRLYWFLHQNGSNVSLRCHNGLSAQHYLLASVIDSFTSIVLSPISFIRKLFS